MQSPAQSAEALFFQAVDLISRKWVLLILHVLMEREQARFGDLTASLPGINTRILSTRLTELEAAGYVVRTVTDTKPVTISYSLTDRARDLETVFGALVTWANRWSPDGSQLHGH